MVSLALLQSLKESVLGQASVKTVYGEPYLRAGEDHHSSCKQCPRRRRWWRRRSTSGTGGRYRGERPANPFRSDYRPEETDRCCASGNWYRYVVGLVQTSLTQPCQCDLQDARRRSRALNAAVQLVTSPCLGMIDDLDRCAIPHPKIKRLRVGNSLGLVEGRSHCKESIAPRLFYLQRDSIRQELFVNS